MTVPSGGVAGQAAAAGSDLGRGGGQPRGLLRVGGADRRLPLRRPRAQPRGRAHHACRRRPETSATVTSAGWGRERSTASAPRARTIRTAGFASTPTSSSSIPTRRRSTAGWTSMRRSTPTGWGAGAPTLVRRSRQRTGHAPGHRDRRPVQLGGRGEPERHLAAADRLRDAREGLHDAPPRHPRVPARDLRGLRPPGGHRLPPEAGGHRGGVPPGARTRSTRAFLEAKGLTNYWGYNTLGYFAPDARFACTGSVQRR